MCFCLLQRSSLEVEDDTTGDGASLESLVGLLESGQAVGLEDDLDLAASGDVDGLDGILSVSIHDDSQR